MCPFCSVHRANSALFVPFTALIVPFWRSVHRAKCALFRWHPALLKTWAEHCQGSVLGPILFLIYISHLPDYIQNNLTVKLFADDTIIYHPITNQQDSNALQEDLDALQRWESDWLMHFHPQKCQTMHITNKRNIIQSTYTIHDHNLQTTNTAKYLGVIPDEINQEKANMFLTPSDFDKIWHTYWDYCEFKICTILDL